MNFKKIIEFCDKAEEMGKDIDNPESYFLSILEMGEYFNKRGEEGREIILRKLKEEDFVKIIRAMKSTLLSSMIIQGQGGSLFAANIANEYEMDGFIHTIILNILGVLAEEEVI